MKVYCKQCKHFDAGPSIPFSYGPPHENLEEQKCNAPQNHKDDHYMPSQHLHVKNTHPWYINKFNDCVWFEPIESDSSSSSSSSSSISDIP